MLNILTVLILYIIPHIDSMLTETGAAIDISAIADTGASLPTGWLNIFQDNALPIVGVILIGMTFGLIGWALKKAGVR